MQHHHTEYFVASAKNARATVFFKTLINQQLAAEHAVASPKEKQGL